MFTRLLIAMVGAALIVYLIDMAGGIPSRDDGKPREED